MANEATRERLGSVRFEVKGESLEDMEAEMVLQMETLAAGRRWAAGLTDITEDSRLMSAGQVCSITWRATVEGSIVVCSRLGNL